MCEGYLQQRFGEVIEGFTRARKPFEIVLEDAIHPLRQEANVLHRADGSEVSKGFACSPARM
jgi:hypothetical protein